MLRFTLIDYTTNSAGVSMQIEEPIGWDGITLRLARHKEWHGFTDFADDSVASLKFVGDGFSMLKTAYETYGANANVQLLIEYQCAEGDTYEQLYLGRFAFATYKDVCGDECYSEITVEALGCLMVFKNRYDQKVDLDSLKQFDPCVNSISLTHKYCVFTVSSSFTVVGEIISADIIGQWITITKSTYNNGTYLVTNVNHSGGDTIITVDATMVLELGVYADLATYCLAPYSGLGQTIYLPSKVLTLTSKWDAGEDTIYPLTELGRQIITPDWANVISEIENTSVATGTYIPSPVDKDNPPDPLIYYTGNTGEGILACGGVVNIDLSFEYETVLPLSAILTEFRIYVVKDYEFNAPYTGQTAGPQQWYWDLNSASGTHTFNQSIQTSISNKEQIWIFFTIQSTIATPSVQLKFYKDTNYSFFKISIQSECTSTVAKIYEINETLSRCVEAYTNDCMRVYSDYYGRTDAQPYPSGVDGCGGLRAISNGLKIRNASTPDGSPTLMTVSMKECFDALNCIDNIGMGLEDDPHRPYENAKLIRVEPFQYFYNNSVLMVCDSIREIKRSVDSALIYSTFKTGYAKFETWNNNGLFDVFANREYRTNLSTLKNELDRTCQWIASDYALEITRRLYGTTTSDWRYDNDIFLLCLNRFQYNYNVTGQFLAGIFIVVDGNNYKIKVGDSIIITGTASNNGTFTVNYINYDAPFNTTQIGVVEALTTESVVSFNIQAATNYIEVEQGLDSPSNILNPDTVMNYRLAPSRNAMRWFKTILQSYRQYLDGELIFTNGWGNLVAQGEVLEPCRLENGVIQEKQNITLGNFTNPTDNYPLFFPELVEFDYPMTYEQYLTVYANPYGLIGYQCGNGAIEYGWIVDMKYSPYNGTVNFTLRPKIET